MKNTMPATSRRRTPRYNGRDVAIVRAQAAGACVVLGSATPSLESRYNAATGKYTLLEIPDRIADRPMPTVHVVDMRQEFLETRKHAIFSRALIEAIRERLANNEQAMVLLNRRGFSTFVACRSCGARVECINCSVTLTYHRRDRRLLCHYCGYAERIPSVCPKCQSEHVHFLGVGSERVEDELHGEFPEAESPGSIATRWPASASSKRFCKNFRERNFDILVGTQMIAKGHDIPNVTLVGVVSADVGIGMPDFRAAERRSDPDAGGRTRRARRSAGHGLHADHQSRSLRDPFAAQQDYAGFFEKELQFRRFMKYPPFAAMANMLVRAAKQEDALRMSTELGHASDARAGKHADHGTGGSARAAAESGVPLSAADQVGKPKRSKRAAASARRISRGNRSGARRRW